MPEPRRITVTELRNELPELLYRVELLGESFLIVKRKKVLAVLRPPTTKKK